MKIRSFSHKGLRRLYESDSARGVPPAVVDKLRNMLFFLQGMGSVDELRAVGIWKAHTLGGSRGDTWSLHVTKNWRLTFRVENNEIAAVNLEDYH